MLFKSILILKISELSNLQFLQESPFIVQQFKSKSYKKGLRFKKFNVISLAKSYRLRYIKYDCDQYD